MKITEAAATGFPIRREGWAEYLTEQPCPNGQEESVMALCFKGRINPCLDLEDLLADDWEVERKPMNLIEAAASGRPFKRPDWVDMMDFRIKSPAQAQGFYLEDLLATDYILGGTP